MLEADGATVRFGSGVALDGVSLSIEPGSCWPLWAAAAPASRPCCTAWRES